MNDDDIPTSFDALAHEHNLSSRMRDLAREFFKLGVSMGRKQRTAVEEKKPRPYHPALDKDTAPGEFR